MRLRDLIPFFFMTFLITWGIIALFVLAPDMMAGLFGNLTGTHPLYYLANWAPAISALILILYRHGVAGVRRFLSRLLLWRASLYWYGLIIVVIPLVFYVSAVFKVDEYTALFPFTSFQAYLMALLLMLFKGPVEELGWRGLALPMLQRRMAPIWAGLVIGVIWGIWHFPAFLLSGTVYSTWSVMPFFVGTVALSIIMTPLFNRSHGSILIAALFHLQMINPLWPDAQPYDTWGFVIVAAIVVWLNRTTMFSRKGAITEIFPI